MIRITFFPSNPVSVRNFLPSYLDFMWFLLFDSPFFRIKIVKLDILIYIDWKQWKTIKTVMCILTIEVPRKSILKLIFFFERCLSLMCIVWKDLNAFNTFRNYSCSSKHCWAREKKFFNYYCTTIIINGLTFKTHVCAMHISIENNFGEI